MSSAYHLDAYNTSGVLQLQFVDFLWLSAVRAVNSPGILAFGVKGDHRLMSAIEDKWQIELWRRPDGGSWTRELVGLYREPEWRHEGKPVATLYCPGLMSMLGWRIINWPANTDELTRFLSYEAETIMKTLVKYNAGAQATTGNGRKRTGTITGLTVEADGANGNDLYWYCHGDNLLKNLQDLARIGGGDYDLVKTSPTAWEFRWYTGQLGTDRTATLAFAMGRANMDSPVYRQRRMEEKTVACVWGQGDGADRAYVTRTGANYLASNDIEAYVDARQVDGFGGTDGLNAVGDAFLKTVEASSEFNFQAVQTANARYGIDYFLGDLATAVNPYNGDEHTVKLVKVSIGLAADGQETITPEWSSVI